jgi:hypothetical protein
MGGIKALHYAQHATAQRHPVLALNMRDPYGSRLELASNDEVPRWVPAAFGAMMDGLSEREWNNWR